MTTDWASSVTPRLYIAGPLFSVAEKKFNRELRDLLSPFFTVYLPQEDGQLLVDLASAGEDVENAMKRIFEADLSAIRNSDALVFIMDGRAPDEGACVELGYAYSLGKTCVGLQTDPRRLLPLGNNPMIMGALSSAFSSADQLLEWAASFKRR